MMKPAPSAADVSNIRYDGLHFEFEYGGNVLRFANRKHYPVELTSEWIVGYFGILLGLL